jgi:hypothetical protein
MRMYRDGRQIFRIARKRCIREEDYESNNRLIDKVLINTDVSMIIIIMNRPVGFIIRALKKRTHCQRVCWNTLFPC